MGRYPYEDEIEDIVKRFFTPQGETAYAFNNLRGRTFHSAPTALGMLKIRDLVYGAMQKSYNDGIEHQKSGKVGQHTN